MLEDIQSRLSAAGLPIHTAKSIYKWTSVQHLGYEISEDSIKAEPTKAEFLAKVRAPKDCKEIANFLGSIVFYSKFVPNFADHAQPLR